MTRPKPAGKAALCKYGKPGRVAAGHIMYATSCMASTAYAKSWKFCPYCGKKIKVVK